MTTDLGTGMTILTADACWPLSRDAEVGRLAGMIGDHPDIFPINPHRRPRCARVVPVARDAEAALRARRDQRAPLPRRGSMSVAGSCGSRAPRRG
jgi:hypothetical protein